MFCWYRKNNAWYIAHCYSCPRDIGIWTVNVVVSTELLVFTEVIFFLFFNQMWEVKQWKQGSNNKKKENLWGQCRKLKTSNVKGVLPWGGGGVHWGFKVIRTYANQYTLSKPETLMKRNYNNIRLSLNPSIILIQLFFSSGLIKIMSWIL